MVIDKEVYRHYRAIQKEAVAIEKTILVPRAKEVICALSKKRVDFSIDNIEVGFHEKSFSWRDVRVGWGRGRGDDPECEYADIDLLFDENWEATIRDYLEKRDKAWNERMERLEREEKEKAEKKERDELARLLAKYPDMGKTP